MKDVSNATAYALLIPSLMKAGREVGYALAVHGSLARDLDIIAVPWTDEAVSAERLIMHLMAAGIETGAQFTGAPVANALCRRGERRAPDTWPKATHLLGGVVARLPGGLLREGPLARSNGA